MRQIILCKTILFCFLLSGAAAGDEDREPPEWTELAAPSQACPDLFGDVNDREENQECREHSLESIRVREYCIDVTHTVNWSTPRKVRLTGLELVDTGIHEDGEPFAVLELDEPLEEIECEPGLYLVRVDDSIGADARVLAILENVILIECDDDLAYLPIEGEEIPEWRLIWRSTWKMPRLPNSGSYRKSRTSRRRRRRSRRRKKRGRRRRR